MALFEYRVGQRSDPEFPYTLERRYQNHAQLEWQVVAACPTQGKALGLLGAVHKSHRLDRLARFLDDVLTRAGGRDAGN